MKTPIVFFIYNRPDITQKSFDRVADASPECLFIIADGPKGIADVEPCMRVRELVSHICWPCEVWRDFAADNLGCKKRISSGLDRVFSVVDRAIILEDDCVADPTFFGFCEHLLEIYEEDPRIMHISGSNLCPTGTIRSESYFFSRYVHLWGWATWRRAWHCYDVEMKQWPGLRSVGWLRKRGCGREAAEKMLRAFDAVYEGAIDTWDYQWQFACFLNNGLSLTPGVNLVSNIGFDVRARHTKDKNHSLANMPVQAMRFPLRHPRRIHPDRVADRRTERTIFELPDSPCRRMARRLKARLRAWLGAQLLTSA